MRRFQNINILCDFKISIYCGGNKATTYYSKALVETDNMTLLLDVLHCQVQSYYRTTAALQHRLAQLFAADKAPQVTSH